MAIVSEAGRPGGALDDGDAHPVATASHMAVQAAIRIPALPSSAR